MKINNTTLNGFREDFQEAVKSLEKKYGIVIKAKTITYGPDEFYFKVEVKNGSSQEDVFKKDFDKWCEYYNLEKSDYLRTFKADGKEYQIVGIDPDKRKRCIVIEALSDGKKYRCSSDFIPFVNKRTIDNVL